MTMAEARVDETRVLSLSRVFEAPRERLFRAWTEPERLARWWGPKGFTTPECAMDVREGGAWRTVMRSPEGKDHVVSGVYREVAPPSRLVFTWGWETDGPRGHETVVTIQLTEVPGGTRLDLSQELFESTDSRDHHGQGWASCFDSLEDVIAAGGLD